MEKIFKIKCAHIFFNKNNYSAFSLVELMFFVVGLSVIFAAFMPVISKRISSDSPKVRLEGAVRYDCQQFGDNCRICYKKHCLLCELDCPSGKVKDPDSCTCK